MLHTYVKKSFLSYGNLSQMSNKILAVLHFTNSVCVFCYLKCRTARIKIACRAGKNVYNGRNRTSSLEFQHSFARMSASRPLWTYRVSIFPLVFVQNNCFLKRHAYETVYLSKSIGCFREFVLRKTEHYGEIDVSLLIIILEAQDGSRL